MPNNDDQLQQQYQEILNKYATSIAPTEPTLPPIETPKIEELIPPASPEIIPEAVISEPTVTVPPIYFPPEPQIVDKPSDFFKYLFYFSLLLFIAVASAIIYNFSSSQSAPTTTAPTPTKIISQFCELGNKKYSVGQSFASDDTCNTCSCTPNLTIACTQKACVSPTPTVKLVGKVYKDIKYGYQFECPITAKYVLEATSVNGNTIPYKQESCTIDNSSVVIAVFDNTVIHSFGNEITNSSPNKKYIISISGDNDDLVKFAVSSFKFL